MPANILLQCSGPLVTYNTRSGTLTSDANSLISVPPYGNDIRDLMAQGCVPSPADGGPVLPWVTGRFYGGLGTILESFLTILGTMYAYPIYVPNQCTVASLNMSSLTGQTGGKMRCALYADNGAGYPGALIAGTDSGDLAATATAVATKSSVATVINPGWYWVASIFTASSTMPSVAAIKTNYTNKLPDLIGFSTAANALATSAQAPTGIAVTGQTYPVSAMPATFPLGAAPVMNADTPGVAIGI